MIKDKLPMTDDKFKWKRMCFKDNKVWLATDHKGTPVKKNGKVLIKYQLKHEYEYWVNEKNIEPVNRWRSREAKSGRKKKSLAQKQSVSKKTEPEYDKRCKNMICIFTDGASSGNPGPSGIGAVLCFGNHEKEISKYIGIATNNIAELKAIHIGLLELKNTNLPVRIFTDSGYAYGMLQLGWKARKNQDLINSIKKEVARFADVKFIKIKGHAGIKYNEKADILATSAIKTKNTHFRKTNNS